MALATRCPHCGTTFRVANDQLKLRAGLVRCGACKEIFNGIEHLLAPVNTPPPAPKPAVLPPLPPKVEAPPEDTPGYPLPGQPAATTEEPESQPEPQPEPEPEQQPEPQQDATPAVPQISRFSIDFDVDDAEPPAPAPPAVDDPLQRMTLMDIAYMRQAAAQAEADPADPAPEPDAPEPEQPQSTVPNTNTRFVRPEELAPDPLDQAMEDLDRKPWRAAGGKLNRRDSDNDADEIDALDTEDEPGFMARERRQQKLGPRQRIALRAIVALLALALLGQGLYLLRHQVAGWFPQTKPLLASACAVFGCRIDLPAQIDAVSIESSELQTLAGSTDTFVLNVLLRNRGASVQAWPHIELTLNDAGEKPLVRRVFTGADYLPAPAAAAELAQGFPAASEKSIKLTFQVAQAKASGYRVYLFYP